MQSGISYSPNTPLENPSTSRLCKARRGGIDTAQQDEWAVVVGGGVDDDGDNRVRVRVRVRSGGGGGPGGNRRQCRQTALCGSVRMMPINVKIV